MLLPYRPIQRPDSHGWPLDVIEGAADDPVVERPEAFVRALRATLEGSGRLEAETSRNTAP